MTAPTVVEPPHVGRGTPYRMRDRIPAAMRGRATDFFVYSAQFLPLVASATGTFETAIQADSDFLIVAGTRFVTDTATPPVVAADALQLCTIEDTGSGRRLQDRSIPIDNWFGTGQRPTYWPEPKLVRASSTLRTEVTNLFNADVNLRLAFLGFKIFGYAES